jgi:hypothetical protein
MVPSLGSPIAGKVQKEFNLPLQQQVSFSQIPQADCADLALWVLLRITADAIFTVLLRTAIRLFVLRESERIFCSIFFKQIPEHFLSVASVTVLSAVEAEWGLLWAVAAGPAVVAWRPSVPSADYR